MGKKIDREEDEVWGIEGERGRAREKLEEEGKNLY